MTEALPSPTLLSSLYQVNREPFPLYQRGDAWTNLTPEQAEEVLQVLLQVGRDPNTLTDPTVLESLEYPQGEAVLQLLMRSLLLPPGETNLYSPVQLDPELFPPEVMNQIHQQFRELFEQNPDLNAAIMNPDSETDLPPFTPVPPGEPQPGDPNFPVVYPPDPFVDSLMDILRDHAEILDHIIGSMNRDQIFADMIRNNPEMLDSIIGSMNRNPDIGDFFRNHLDMLDQILDSMNRNPYYAQLLRDNPELLDPFIDAMNRNLPLMDSQIVPGDYYDPPDQIFADMIRNNPEMLDSIIKYVEEVGLNPQPLPPWPNAPLVLLNLFDPNAPGPTLDPGLFNPNAAGPTLDPALLDPNAPGPTIDPNLLDPAAPGPTLDPSALDPNAPGETLDPNTLDPSAPGPTVDPSALEPSLVEPSGVPDASLTEPPPPEPGVPEPGSPDHDLHDQPGT
jgi:hypothetical protein